MSDLESEHTIPMAIMWLLKWTVAGTVRLSVVDCRLDDLWSIAYWIAELPVRCCSNGRRDS